jgi:hypothetical protein
VQALDRTAPVLPMLPGTPARRTYTYVRNGTSDLYAALDVASGKVITQMISIVPSSSGLPQLDRQCQPISPCT